MQKNMQTLSLRLPLSSRQGEEFGLVPVSFPLLMMTTPTLSFAPLTLFGGKIGVWLTDEMGKK